MQLVEKVDDYGMPAWIGLMVLGFVVFWPVGLAVLAYLIWSGRMGCGKGRRGRWHEKSSFFKRGAAAFAGTSGNHAFDEYREETLRRLEEEQREFSSFLERLRFAKDKAEFEQFMADRRNNPPAAGSSGPDVGPDNGQSPPRG